MKGRFNMVLSENILLNKTGNRKVAIVGTGFVGATIAYALALRNIAREIVLIDIDKDKALGEAMDIRHGMPLMGTTDLYLGEYSDCVNCDLIILTVGRNRKLGESRLDLINDNIKIIKSVIENIQKYYSRGVIMVISNPVDVLTYKVSQWMEKNDGSVFGTGCLLDTSRFVRGVSDYVCMNTDMIHGYLVGEHGEGQIPTWSRTSVGGNTDR